MSPEAAIGLESPLPAAGSYRGPCPQCAKTKRDDALAIRIDDHCVIWYCHRCHYRGGRNLDHPTRAAVAQVARTEQQPSVHPQRWSDLAESIWERAVALSGTVGEAYLLGRSCIVPPIDGDLRFMPTSDKYPPSLVARVTDFGTNAPMSLHFTKLKADGSGKAGTACDKVLLRGHQKKGGVIRLWPDEAVTNSLAVAEGIETALSGAHLHTPIWSTVDAGNLASLPVVSGIESLIVFADHDPSGIAAAQKVVSRWRSADRWAGAHMPRWPHMDINDVSMGVA